MITCKHVSATGRLTAMTVSQLAQSTARAYLKGEKYMFHCITLFSCTGVTGQIMSALIYYFCFMHRSNIMHVCSDASSHFNV